MISAQIFNFNAQKMKFSIKDFFSECDQIHISWINPKWKTPFFYSVCKMM